MTDLSGNVGWTAQSRVGFIHDEGMPGQTFTEDQLPHPEVQRASGINPELYRQQHGLTVLPSDNNRPEFVGTETGVAPHEAIRVNGNVESFASVPATVTTPVEPLEEAPVETLTTTASLIQDEVPSDES